MIRYRREGFSLLALMLLGGPAGAATLSQVRSSAIGWLESHQNADGSWGSGARHRMDRLRSIGRRWDPTAAIPGAPDAV